MSTALGTLLARPRVVLAAVLLLSLSGAIAWMTMPRQEDPTLPDFWGQVIALYPGADAETVERLVAEPVEEHLVEVDEVKVLESVSRAGIAVFEVELVGAVDDVDQAWDDVREALLEASAEFPPGAGAPALDRDLNDQEAIVLAITGSADPMVLRDAAKRLERELLALDTVGRTTLVGDPGEQITIELDDAEARRLGLDPQALAASLASRNEVLPGGSVELDGQQVTLRPRTEFRSIEEIAVTPLVLPSGAAVPLGEVAAVRRGPVEPARERMRHEGALAVGVGIVPRGGADVTDMGLAVRRLVDERREGYAPLRIDEMAYQPQWVQGRINGLGRSLLMGILIVAAVIVAAMGIRLGLVVAAVVPLVVLSALALWALGGGTLHQMAVAAVVIALGMLVDNAIVVAENVQARVDRGEDPRAASVGALRELVVPLAAATGTTLAAFVPMLASEGPTGEFTRAIPVLVMTTLVISYGYAVLVTPLMARYVLRRRDLAERGAGKGSTPAGGRLPALLSRVAIGRPALVLTLAALLVTASLLVSGRVGRQFFPASDRNRVVVDLELPESAHLDETDAAAREVERYLASLPEVSSVSSFVGRSVPHFYYNLPRIPQAPNFAQVVVSTRRKDQVDEVVRAARSFVRTELPRVESVARRLDQGPPVAAPVEVRLSGHDLGALGETAARVLGELRDIPGTTDERHDLGVGAPTVYVGIDDAAAARRGVSRADVALALYGRTRGLPVGHYRAGDDPVPVLLRSSLGEDLPAEGLQGLDISAPGGDPVPLAQVARLEVGWRPATIRHYGRSRVVQVYSQLEEGAEYGEVLAALVPRLEAAGLPAGVAWSLGGAAEGSGEANGALMASLPLGLLLLVGILLLEFNSFRRLAIILATVPLAAAGVVPGLLLGNQSFGFMSLLGVIALVGVVVNNAIVLLDVVERRRRAGDEIPEALAAAVRRRTRPILLTTATTVAGLMPLALSASSLWPPLAWAMISGLLASTLLTLLVVPALYLLFFAPGRVLALPRPLPRRAAASAAASLLLVALLLAGTARAQSAPDGSRRGGVAVTGISTAPAFTADVIHLTLGEAMQRAVSRPRVGAAGSRAAAARDLAVAEARSGYMPSVVGGVDLAWQDQAQVLNTPIGSFPFSDERTETFRLSLIQPIFSPKTTFYEAPAARRGAEAASLAAERSGQQAAAEAAGTFLDLLALDATTRATLAFIESLEESLAETEARVREGRSLEADALKVRLALESAELDLLTLRERRRVATLALGRAVGEDGPVEPVWEGDDEPGPPPTLEEAVARAFEHRPDLAALEKRIDAARLRKGAVNAEYIPRVVGSVGWARTGGVALEEDGRTTFAVSLLWRPIAAGTRARRASALERESEALRAEYLEARRGIEVELRRALAEMEIARGAVRVGERGVEQAGETVRVEQERYRAGRITTNDLLEAEAELRRQRTRRDVAALEVVRARVRLGLATGEESGAAILGGGA